MGLTPDLNPIVRAMSEMARAIDRLAAAMEQHNKQERIASERDTQG